MRKNPTNMIEEVTIFNKINERKGFGFTGAQIASWSGVDASQISRFLNGKTDISVSKFFKVISSMPESFQEAYWTEILNFHYVTKREKKEIHWSVLISEASYKDLQEILNAIGLRWAELEKSQTKSKELVST